MSEPPVVSALIETFTSILADKVLEEVSLITDFKNDFEFLCDELFSVKLLLDEAGQNSTSRSMSNWLEKLEYFLIDAVDIVDECGASNFGNSIFSNFEKLIFRHKMGSRIRTLRKRINDIHGSAKYLKHLMSVLQINALNVHNLEDRREIRSSAPLKESHIVGISHHIAEITELILKENDDPHAIAVVGMGGMGKTLLVQSVSKSQMVQERFDHVVWLPVSQNFDLQHVLLQIARKMKFPRAKNQNVTTEEASVRNLTMEEIKSKIIKDLERSRCLFVVDGLWKDDWCKIEWLSVGKTKILVTTRHRSVAKTMLSSQVHIHSMTCLSEEDSIKLFCIYAFPDSGDTQKSTEDTDISLPDQHPKEVTEHSAATNNGFPNQLPESLRSLTEQIVKKCDGLPLALKTIGASMARGRMLPNEWERILKSLNEAPAMSEQVWPSLRLSYQALPNHLKLCFDYCSSFPKNTPLKSEYLVNAWIDEGFIPQTAEHPYDVGVSYINELIDRCLLEVWKLGGDGQVKYCKMHDLLHELAHLESQKKTKCLLKPGNELNEFPVRDSVGLRRISLIENNIEAITQPIKCPGLRSLFLWKNVSLKSISASFFEDMKYLAVLDLSQTSITSLTETVGHLRHLKLLNLSQTKIAKLPKSLAELKSLQFLDVSQCQDLREMHSGIGEHKAMIHLNVKGSDNLESLPVGISKLTYLHTLKGPVFKSEKAPTAKAFQWRAALKRGNRVNAKALQWWDLKRLTNLQHLSLTLEAPSSKGSIRLEEGTFGSMANMRFLSFKYINSSKGSRGLLELPSDIKVMHRLEILHLKGCVVQDWIFGLENLMELELHGDNGSTPDYLRLRNIPNLRKLKLSSNDKCVKFPEEFGERGAFPKLEYFVIKHFNSLENFPPLQDGALPMLKCFQMKYCSKLKDITKDITKALQRRNSIEEIRVKECPGWEDGIWKDKHTWKLLKDRPIKLIINGYTISWALDQFNNSTYRLHFKEREKLRLSLLVCKTAVLFMEGTTSSAAGVVEQRTLQNSSGVECQQQQMDEHKEKSVAGVTGMKNEE